MRRISGDAIAGRESTVCSLVVLEHRRGLILYEIAHANRYALLLYDFRSTS